jgi:hypothetical protein
MAGRRGSAIYSVGRSRWFEYYLFCVHGEFVVVIAAGEWFDAPSSYYPLAEPPESATVGRFVAHKSTPLRS